MGAGARSRRNNRFAVGDLVQYKFKSWDGYRDEAGLVIEIIEGREWETSPVYKILGLDGETYMIHPEYLESIGKENDEI